ncbi:hypothetical protein Pan241w_26550 [Gimesia alba]|uniref:Uncharacterized protein n=1 Tax=Gimesia alba TaxID=2527973 RepID=A0A517RFD9_9PLAN|nr:hypothetical protein Pan241w_26550 [Gimesia alba]
MCSPASRHTNTDNRSNGTSKKVSGTAPAAGFVPSHQPQGLRPGSSILCNTSANKKNAPSRR